jgi:hypothetical protein
MIVFSLDDSAGRRFAASDGFGHGIVDFAGGNSALTAMMEWRLSGRLTMEF